MMEANDNAAYPDDNPLVFYSNPGQLQELACVATIASVWHHQMKTKYHSDISSDELTLTVRGVDCSDFAQLPSVLEQMIKKRIPVVEHSFEKWFDFHRCEVFYNRKKAAVLDFISFISWRADGKICYEQTAKKLIKSDLLSYAEKYIIACIYCFVDDVRKLWPRRKTTKDDHRMVRYWNSRMSGKRCTIRVDPECSCIEASLLKYEVADTRSAFEYLWRFLTDEERVPMVVRMCTEVFFSGPGVFLKDALSKLNERQLEHTMISDARNIFLTMLRKSKNFVVKNIVTNGDFYQIIFDFLWWDFRYEAMGGRPAFKGYDLAFEIWITAPNAMKNYILEADNRLQELLGRLCYHGKKFYSRYGQSVQEVRFLIEVLSSMSQANRDKFWKENWRAILRIISPKRTQLIMKLCLQSDDEIASFKTSHLISRNEKYCSEMVKDGNFSHLSDFLELCFDDPVVVFTHRISVLKSKELLRHFIGGYRVQLTLPQLNSFKTFINETFPDTDALNEYKRNLIFGEESMAYFRSLIQICDLRNVSLLVDHVMFSMPELPLAKSKFLELSRDCLILGELDCDWFIDRWINFIIWCLDDDDSALENFKLSLPVDQIFNAYFVKCAASAKQLTSWTSFRKMEIVEWIFPTQEAFQNFKLGKLGAYEGVPQIRSVFESSSMKVINEVLMWFFKDDEEQVKKFKVPLKRVKFPKMKPTSEIRSLNVSSYRLRPRTRQHSSQKEIYETSSCRAKLRKRKNTSQADSSNVSSSYRAKLRKRKTASK